MPLLYDKNTSILLYLPFSIPIVLITERTSTRVRRRAMWTETSSVNRSTPSPRHLEARDSLPLRSLHSVSLMGWAGYLWRRRDSIVEQGKVINYYYLSFSPRITDNGHAYAQFVESLVARRKKSTKIYLFIYHTIAQFTFHPYHIR